MGRKDKLKFVVNHDTRNVSALDPKGKEVGFVALEKYGDAAKNNEVFQMGVKPSWRRMGLMSDLHNEAEKHFGTINPSPTLTDDGFSFWKAWRPEAVKDRYRFYQDKLLGLPAPTKFGQGVISSVGDKTMIAKLPNGNTAMVNPDHADQLFQNAQQQDSVPEKAGGGALDNDEGITAYHGSPHDFEQFDTSKIGTGEGNQSFGHGLYFAGNEDVAKGYRDRLAGHIPGSVQIGDEQHPHWARKEVAKAFSKLGYDPQTSVIAAHLINEHQGDLEKASSDIWNNENIPDSVYEALLKTEYATPAGHMYEVHIDAHPDHFLDWDAPISQQDDHIKNATYNSLIKRGLSPFMATEIINRSTGKDVIHSIIHGEWMPHMETVTSQNGKIASDLLSHHGVKGIKYLDAGSRGASEGTHNYVVFDHNHVKVRRKYEHGGMVDEAA